MRWRTQKRSFDRVGVEGPTADDRQEVKRCVWNGPYASSRNEARKQAFDPRSEWVDKAVDDKAQP
jgi:hypothetical protein